MKNTWELGAAEDWFKVLPAEKQDRFKQQDRERIAAHIAVNAGRMTVQEFVTLCATQFRENMADAPMLRRTVDDDDQRSIAERAGLVPPQIGIETIAEDDHDFTDEYEDEVV